MRRLKKLLKEVNGRIAFVEPNDIEEELKDENFEMEDAELQDY